ncbi:hypothetical protein PR001_g33332 [Phytophthora rubi]|uniref:Reverse transcriptase Ty1/copia-type domain-containing protein n=1 Tax=Phytophthora rubi TaxID=129364 RepID=A0A6A3G1I4_9STRA|nr:hypothetical protein PR001_g33332 [Phytophthora rubi]
MIIAAKTSEDIREVKDALKNAFKMKELGPAKFILGMEIDHDMTAGTLKIKQTRYIDDVVERFGQENAKPVDNPCAAGLKLSKTQSPGTDAEQNAMRSKPYRLPAVHPDVYASGYRVRGHSAFAFPGEPRTSTLERCSACATIPQVDAPVRNNLPRWNAQCDAQGVLGR